MQALKDVNFAGHVTMEIGFNTRRAEPDRYARERPHLPQGLGKEPQVKPRLYRGPSVANEPGRADLDPEPGVIVTCTAEHFFAPRLSSASAPVSRISGALAADPSAALAELANTILVKDVNGVAAQPISVIKLSDDELAKIKGMNATAAIVMHYGGNDWSQAQIQALQTQFASMGIKVIAVTDAGFKAEKQVSDIETVLAQKPNIIISASRWTRRPRRSPSRPLPTRA